MLSTAPERSHFRISGDLGQVHEHPLSPYPQCPPQISDNRRPHRCECQLNPIQRQPTVHGPPNDKTKFAVTATRRHAYRQTRHIVGFSSCWLSTSTGKVSPMPCFVSLCIGQFVVEVSNPPRCSCGSSPPISKPEIWRARRQLGSVAAFSVFNHICPVSVAYTAF